MLVVHNEESSKRCDEKVDITCLTCGETDFTQCYIKKDSKFISCASHHTDPRIPPLLFRFQSLGERV
eukprot:2679682-Amphidinium_carterae.1